MTTEPITLAMAFDDPAPLDFDQPRKALDNLADALVEDVLNASDEEILEEFREDRGDPEHHAIEMRALLEKSIAIANERRITCRVHHLPSPANAQGLLLCQDCLDNLDSAAQHIAELRETTIDGWLSWLASQDDATIAWWHKMEALDPPTFAGKCALALEKGGRGAAVVSAWRAKEDALGRCAAAEREIEGAR